jgi:hypothetical protein
VELDSSDVSFNAELVAHPDPDYEPGEALFIRGDVNGDGEVDISDPVAALLHLFRGQAIGCEDALDFDDSGALNISDVIYGLDFLFRGGEPIPAPYPARGEDASADVLGCETVG